MFLNDVTILLCCRIKFSNVGNVRLEFSWHAETCGKSSPIAVKSTPDVLPDTCMPQDSPCAGNGHQLWPPGDGEDDDSRISQPFSIEPCVGLLLPKETMDLTVKFSPLDVGTYVAQLICQ